jgi:hypothetical protein
MAIQGDGGDHRMRDGFGATMQKRPAAGAWLFLRLANSLRRHKSTTTVQAIGMFAPGSARMAVSGHVPDIGVRLSYGGHLARTKTISNFCLATAW